MSQWANENAGGGGAQRKDNTAFSVDRASKTSFAGAAPPELQTSEDMLAWKREYNIRQRDADWKRRQEEALTQKQTMWQIERSERDNRIAAARETRRKEELEGRIYHRHKEIDRKYKDRCREAEIEKRQQAWADEENARLVALQRQAQEEKKAATDRRALEKARKFEELRVAAAERAEKLKRNQELNRLRFENIRKKELARTINAADDAKCLGSDEVAKAEAVVVDFG